MTIVPRINILLVDSQQQQPSSIKAALAEADYNLLQAASGYDALRLLLEYEVLLILLDINMPDMDGFDVAAFIRQRQQSKHTPIIFISAENPTDEVILKCSRLGAFDYLVKPINPYLLRSKIAFLVELFNRNNTLIQAEQLTRKTAEDANKMKDGFLAMISHELRTPLTAMLSWSRLLRTGKLGPAESKRALETIERNIKVQALLITDLLDLSRILTGKMSLNISSVSMAVIIEDAIDAIRPALESKKIELKTSIELFHRPVSGDALRLQQILWNLLTNAIKFTPAEGSIEISFRQIENNFEIVVSDTGEGISKEYLPRIFELFSQADAKNTRVLGGLGLGLSIVHSLVELHGGSISVASAGKGKGATFCVTLPVKEVPALHLDNRASDNIDEVLNGVRVLVVDDNADARTILICLLKEHNVAVTAVSSAVEAIAAIRELKPQVIISDIEMLGGSGYELIRSIKELEAETGELNSVVALTAHSGEADRKKILAAGFLKHLSKPIEPQELIKVISDLALEQALEKV